MSRLNKFGTATTKYVRFLVYETLYVLNARKVSFGTILFNHGTYSSCLRCLCAEWNLF